MILLSISSMGTRLNTVAFLVLLLAGNAYALPKWFHGKKHGKANETASASVVSGTDGCKVDVDGVDAGTTGSDGTLIVKDIEPGDHYIHVQCPNQRETSTFVSATAGHELDVDAREAATNSGVTDSSQFNRAASELQLRQIVSEADQLRSSGQFEEAVELLRKATMLDPRNGDLHRELGITFLMFHQWEGARIEMLEAVRREPESVDAHSGLAYALEKLGDLDAALQQYQICQKMDPHDTSYRDHYVQVLGQLYAEKAKKNR